MLMLSGSRRGSHPPAPTDPGVTISTLCRIRHSGKHARRVRRAAWGTDRWQHRHRAPGRLNHVGCHREILQRRRRPAGLASARIDLASANFRTPRSHHVARCSARLLLGLLSQHGPGGPLRRGDDEQLRGDAHGGELRGNPGLNGFGVPDLVDGWEQGWHQQRETGHLTNCYLVRRMAPQVEVDQQASPSAVADSVQFGVHASPVVARDVAEQFVASGRQVHGGPRGGPGKDALTRVSAARTRGFAHAPRLVDFAIGADGSGCGRWASPRSATSPTA